MASDVDICNLALQFLGAKPIVSIDDVGSPNAARCKIAYAPQRDAELRRHPWSFAKKRVHLPALSSAPVFGYDNAFELPADYIRLLPQSTVTDWHIEGRQIFTNDDAPLEVIYIARITDTGLFDALFVELLAVKLAYVLCEPITQSNSKKEEARAEYKRIVAEARRVNAFERVSDEPPVDDWILARL